MLSTQTLAGADTFSGAHTVTTALRIWLLWEGCTAGVRGLGAVASSNSSVNTADGLSQEEIVQEMYRVVRQQQAHAHRLLCPPVSIWNLNSWLRVIEKSSILSFYKSLRVNHRNYVPSLEQQHTER